LFEGQEILFIPFKKSGFLSGYPQREVDKAQKAGEFKPLLPEWQLKEPLLQLATFSET